MNKKGFVATSILYTFLVVFMFLIATILANYAYNRNLLIKLSNNIKKGLNNDVQSASPFHSSNIKKSINNFFDSNDDIYEYEEDTEIDYSNGKWAEIKLKTNSSDYSYLWVPAFKYKLPDNYDFSKNSEDIDIVFLTEDEIKNTMKIGDDYKIPSAFKLWNNNENYRLISGFFIKTYSYGSVLPNLGDKYYSNYTSNNQFEAVKYLQHSKYKTDQFNTTEKNIDNCYIREWFINENACNYRENQDQYCEFFGGEDETNVVLNPWLENKPFSEKYETETFNYYKDENDTKNFNSNYVINYINTNEIKPIENCVDSNYRYTFFKLEEE